MRIVNTYEDLQHHATRFMINNQSYRIDTDNLYKSIPTTGFKFLLARGAFKLITKHNA